MTTWPSDQTRDQWSTTGTCPWPTEPGVPTMTAYLPPTVASRAAAEFHAAAPSAARQPYVPDLACSTEQPEFASPLPVERPRLWFMRSGVLAFVGGGLVAAAAAGLFGALHNTHSTPVDTTSHSAPAAAPASANPASTPGNQTNPVSTPGNQTKSATTTHSVMASRGSSGSTSHQSPHQSPSQYSTSSSSGQHTNDQSGQNSNDQQWQSDHDSVSTPPTWNRNDYYWFTHRRDNDDRRWTGDHDSDDRSSSGRGDNSQSSHDQSSDNHSTGSNESGEFEKPRHWRSPTMRSRCATSGDALIAFRSGSGHRKSGGSRSGWDSSSRFTRSSCPARLPLQLKTQIRPRRNRAAAAARFVVPRDVHRRSGIRPNRRSHRAPTGVSVQPGVVLRVERHRRRRADPLFLAGARFMAGIGVGAEYPVADSYLSDVLPKAHRGRLAARAYTCSFLAVPALGFLSLSLNNRSLFGVEGWRMLLYRCNRRIVRFRARRDLTGVAAVAGGRRPHRGRAGGIAGR